MEGGEICSWVSGACFHIHCQQVKKSPTLQKGEKLKIYEPVLKASQILPWFLENKTALKRVGFAKRWTQKYSQEGRYFSETSALAAKNSQSKQLSRLVQAKSRTQPKRWWNLSTKSICFWNTQSTRNCTAGKEILSFHNYFSCLLS